MTDSTSVLFQAEDPPGGSPQRVLAIGGLLAVICGMLFGDVFAMFVLHPNNARIGQALAEAAQMIPVGDTDGILSRFASIGGFLENRGTKVDAHSHMIHLGYLALLLALLQPWIAFRPRQKLRLAWLFVVPAFLLPAAVFAIHYVGVAYSPLQHIGWASVVADLSGLLLAVAASLSLWGMWRHFRSGAAAESASGFAQRDDAASRTLLVGGLLLLVCGFLYGAGYAAWGLSGSSAAEVDILKDIVTQAAGQRTDALNAAFGAFGDYQMYRAINIAVHTHINEFGILLLLLSFIQPYVYYPDAWKRRWARLAVLGGFGLPVGVLLELKAGVVGKILADSFGFIAICAVMAMLFGLLRHTGAADSRQRGVA